jgi:hypothetical protein
MLDPPSVVGTAVVQGVLLATEGADAAVAFGACVEALEVSPGNCAARCGLIDGEALMPTVDPVDSLLAELGCGTGSVVGTVVAGTFSGSAEVSLKLVPPGTGWLATGGALTEAALLDADVPVVVVLGDGDELVWVWACAMPQAASHRMTAGANRRCIASSFSRDIR